MHRVHLQAIDFTTEIAMRGYVIRVFISSYETDSNNIPLFRDFIRIDWGKSPRIRDHFLSRRKTEFDDGMFDDLKTLAREINNTLDEFNFEFLIQNRKQLIKQIILGYWYHIIVTYPHKQKDNILKISEKLKRKLEKVLQLKRAKLIKVLRRKKSAETKK
jgi:hypothetical protein